MLAGTRHYAKGEIPPLPLYETKLNINQLAQTLNFNGGILGLEKQKSKTFSLCYSAESSYATSLSALLAFSHPGPLGLRGPQHRAALSLLFGNARVTWQHYQKQ